jgi:cytochrome c oxidase subunit III
MSSRRALDVSALPKFAFGHHGLIWWGTTGFMVIEGSMFLVAMITYFYLRLRVTDWPPGLPNPDVGFATANTLLLIVSLLPNHLAKTAAEQLDLRGARAWTWVVAGFGVAAVVLRGFEYTQLNCRWDSNAYGSIVWVLLSLHTLHLLTDVADSAVLGTLLITGPIEGKRFVDASENALYWYFVVLSWMPIYVTLYFAPRWL